MRRIISRVMSMNAAEFALASFISASLLGAVALMITENGRETIEPRAVLHEVTMRPAAGGEEKKETHTTVVFVENGNGLRFVDAWFTAASALCVVGLTTVDFSKFTLLGQLTVLLLIQMGGLGVFVFTSILTVAIFQGVAENSSFRNMLASAVDSDHHDVLAMLKYITLYSAVIEVSGFLIMGAYLTWFCEDPPIGSLNPWWWALFHSISAFNNAGLSLMSNNLVNFVYDPVINLTITGLIILGGLGYPVLIAIYGYSRGLFGIRKSNHESGNGDPKDISGVASKVQVKIALVGTVVLLVVGTALTYWVEFDNSFDEHPNLLVRILPAWFQSVSTRTAGFNTVDLGAMHVPTLFLFMILMFIGANPAGTAGGIKIPTITVLTGYIVDWFRKPGEPVRLFGEPISRFAVSHAIRLFFFATVFVAVVTATINYIERDYIIANDPIFIETKVLFEVISAFGTAGMSMGFPEGAASFSALFSDPAKYLIIVTMFFGRLGPLVVLSALPWKRRYADIKTSEDYPGAQKVQIG